jgi:hypothetical protein
MEVDVIRKQVIITVKVEKIKLEVDGFGSRSAWNRSRAR